MIACKKATERCTACLCAHVETGRQVLVKITDHPGEAQCLEREYGILKHLEAVRGPAAARFPRTVACMASEGKTILVRDFIPGLSVEEYVESEPSRPGIRREMAVRCAISVLEQLSVLHHLRPPVIHRDVKPQNVILGEDGDFHLIDLGIARTPHRDGAADTTVMGTLLTAPPEQYGFRQTDARSDIYAVGILLRYCLTQEYGESADDAIDADLRGIIRRATQFDPQMRYQRAEDMLAALKGPSGRPARRAPWALPIAAAFLVLALLAGLWAVYRANRSYVFREPLIEQAVRRALGRPEGKLTARDLEEVTSVHIFGSQIYDDDSQFSFLGEFVFPLDSGIAADSLWRENGEIMYLDDLRALPNLEVACLYRQQIKDLSPLRGAKLRGLGIGYNPVEDLSPLAGNESLEALNVAGLALSDTAVIATLPRLRELCLCATPVTSLAGLEALPLEALNFADMPLEDDLSLEGLTRLKRLTVSQLRRAPLSHLTALPLESLEVSNARGVSPRDLEVLTGLRRLDYRTEEDVTLTARPLRFDRLEALSLKGVRADSLACLSALTALRELAIYEVECADYRGLESLDSLQTVWASAKQAEALERAYPNHAWTLRIAERLPASQIERSFAAAQDDKIPLSTRARRRIFMPSWEPVRSLILHDPFSIVHYPFLPVRCSPGSRPPCRPPSAGP